MDDPLDVHPVDMNRVVSLVKARGVPAYVEHTGGGVATIYAGEPTPDAAGCPRYPALAGPGWFLSRWEGGRDEPAVGDRGDFCVGFADDVLPTYIEDESEEQVAEMIVRLVQGES